MRQLSPFPCKNQYANAHDMGKGDLEVHAQLQSCDLTGIPESGWDCSRDWSAAVDGYRLSGKMDQECGEERLCSMQNRGWRKLREGEDQPM